MSRTVVYGSDGFDIDRLEMSVESVRKNMGEDTDIIVLSDNKEVFTGVRGVSVVDPMPLLGSIGFESRKYGGKWPFAANFRLAIPVLDVFNGVDRVLYLDTDTLVRRPEAARLFTIPVHDSEIIGASDTPKAQGWGDSAFEKVGSINEISAELASRVWVPFDQDCKRYINSGVIVFSLSNIRKNGIGWWKRRLGFFLKFLDAGILPHPDQDFLNVCTITRADLKWKFNAIGSGFDSKSYIQHFCGRKGLMGKVYESFVR